MKSGLSTKVTTLLGAIGTLVAVGCSHPDKITESTPRMTYTEEAQGKAITNTAATEVKAHDYVEISFPPGSAVLSESSKTSLNTLIDQSGHVGKINEVLVMSWADAEYPSKKLKKLPKIQTDLAAKRNKAIERYIKSYTSNVDVDLYNMAERPSKVSKWFNTTDNRLKESFVAAGLPTTGDNPQYPSKSSHSVVFITLK